MDGDRFQNAQIPKGSNKPLYAASVCNEKENIRLSLFPLLLLPLLLHLSQRSFPSTALVRLPQLCGDPSANL
jgi:hypothetical protein